MTWITWRQFRTSAWITLGGLGVLAAFLAVTGHNLAQQWTSSGAATCHGDCVRALTNFLNQVTSGANERIYQASLLLTYLVPPLIGIFWGAPLVARELESGTHRLAWTQSVTRTRWIATKLTMVGGASAVTAGLLSWSVTSWGHHIDDAKYYRITPLTYGARGIVPIGYALFAFTLGVTLGMLIRRVVPAMATTLAIYVAAIASMPLWIRAHLAPTAHSTAPLDLSKVDAFTLSAPDMKMTVISGVAPNQAWVLSNHTVTNTGHLFTGPASPQYCGPNQGPEACLHWVSTLGLRQALTYQPANHFWPLQWTETGIFIALAFLLAGFSIWWTRRHLT